MLQYLYFSNPSESKCFFLAPVNNIYAIQYSVNELPVTWIYLNSESIEHNCKTSTTIIIGVLFSTITDIPTQMIFINCNKKTFDPVE
jgi:hypothetical protein